MLCQFCEEPKFAAHSPQILQQVQVQSEKALCQLPSDACGKTSYGCWSKENRYLTDLGFWCTLRPLTSLGLSGVYYSAFSPLKGLNHVKPKQQATAKDSKGFLYVFVGHGGRPSFAGIHQAF